MRLLIIFSICGLMSLLSCVHQNKPTGCSRYKKGTFYYKARTPAGTTIIEFVRDDTTQTETVKNTGDTGVFQVKWLDACKYQMKFMRIISNEPDSLKALKKSMTMTISIIEGGDDYYLFESSNDKNNFVLKDTIWQIR